ncbi:unnamed protein product [Allacma fusca]|uniref:Uncharacterized protein n=1 Tax=Allacma fusca TaxID=39272 RepID=A0A8J2JRJ8_9HEXA|nr:unnamed protein product [Allacma fusca]
MQNHGRKRRKQLLQVRVEYDLDINIELPTTSANSLSEGALRARKRRINETADETSRRLLADTHRHREAMARETPEQRELRVLQNAQRRRIRRAAEETHEQRRDRLREATTSRIRNNPLMYNAAIAGNALHIEEQYCGKLDGLCQFCEAKCFPSELNTEKTSRALAFASMGAKIDSRVNDRRGPYVYKIHGQVYHMASPLHPQLGDSPKYAQLYILDSEEALRARMAVDANKD